MLQIDTYTATLKNLKHYTDEYEKTSVETSVASPPVVLSDIQISVEDKGIEDLRKAVEPLIFNEKGLRRVWKALKNEANFEEVETVVKKFD